MRPWEGWEKTTNRTAIHWARHLTPQQPIVLRQGFTYEVRAYVKLEDAHGLGIATGVWSRAGSPVRGHTERYSPVVRGTRDWSWISARVACTSGDGELGWITVALLGKGTAWIDELSVVEYPERDAESINAGCYPPLRLEEIRAETARCLALEFIGDLHGPNAEQPANWLVTSDDDPRFRPGVKPLRVGRTRQLDNPDGTLWWNDTYRHTVFLVLPHAMESAKRYRAVMRNVGSEHEEFPITFDERASVTRAIKTNQYGYLPDARKYGYLGGWLGSAGALPLEGQAGDFRVVEAQSGRSVFHATPKLRMRHDHQESLSTSTLRNLTGEDVYELDFSSYAVPGEYYLVVPGVGRSLGFRIARDVYREPFYHCARAIFHQRCGIELKPPCSSFSRRPCHRGPALEIGATIVEHGCEDEDELVNKDPTIKTGKRLEVWGGYHDAADFDRLIGHIRIPAVLMTLYEMCPQAFSDSQLNLPESGNGIPDILDEACWGVDFWVRMQDAEDGGVRGGAGPNAAVTAPADRDAHPVYAYSKDPISSLSLAAVAGQLARVLERLGKKPEALLYLQRAEKAWAYGLAHGGEKFRIAHALAAIELFRTTGKPEYHQALRKQDPTKFDAFEQERHQGHFAWNVWVSCALCSRPGMDEAMRRACRQRIMAAADQEIRCMETSAYRMPHTGVGGPPVRYGWGCGTNFFAGGDFCVLAWRLSGEKRYRDAALLAADFSLGCHPASTVFITGVGQRHVQWAMHTFSNPMAAKVGAPVKETLPGIPIFGVHGYPQGFSGWQSQLLYTYANPSDGRDNFYPPCKAWPDLRLFADIGWAPILSEFSVASTMLHSVLLYGSMLPAEGKLEHSRLHNRASTYAEIQVLAPPF
jgi:endoglucanase